MVETWQIIVGIGVFVVGVGVGTLLQPSSRKLKARAEHAEAELEEERERFASHRGEVENHFEKTSDLFRDLTHQYASLYTHLAEGARVLAPDRMLEIREGFNLSLLAQGRDAPADASLGASDDAPVVDLSVSEEEGAVPGPTVDDPAAGEVSPASSEEAEPAATGTEAGALR